MTNTGEENDGDTQKYPPTLHTQSEHSTKFQELLDGINETLDYLDEGENASTPIQKTLQKKPDGIANEL